jgi:hypothetical protein
MTIASLRLTKCMTFALEVGMRRFLFATLILAAACGPRQVEVRTAPSQPAQQAIMLTNGLGQAVNVYVNYNGNDQFVQQVRANTALRLPVSGVPNGATVTLKAVTVDGTKSYSKQNVVMTGTLDFSVP